MRALVGIVVIAVVAAGCGGGSTVVVPAGAAAVEDFLELGIADLANTVIGFFDLQLLLTDPEAAEAAGIVFEPDPAGPANQFLFEFPYDSDGDGTDDATAEGTVLVPTVPGGTGSVEFATMDPDGSGSGLLEFRFVAAGIEIWGAGTTTDTASGLAIDFSIPSGEPVVVDPDAGGDGNFCEFDVQGSIQISAAGLAGVYGFVLRLLFGSLDVALLDRLFTAAGEADGQALPDGTLRLPPCRELTIEDWAGTWQLEWFCLPLESGSSAVTFTVTGPDTLEGSSDGIVFTATADPGNPRVVRGFFLDTDGGGTYREDFVFTLAPNGRSWIQDNMYEYISGAETGSTGTCGGTATKVE